MTYESGDQEAEVFLSSLCSGEIKTTREHQITVQRARLNPYDWRKTIREAGTVHLKYKRPFM